MVRDYGMLGFGGITPITQRKEKSCSLRQNGVTLYAVMCDYFTIMLMIAIIAIIAIILFDRKSDSGVLFIYESML
jgi:hypothetical protein